MILNIWSDLKTWFIDFFSDIQNFFVAHSRNPFLWVAIILIGLLIFELVYRALHRD